MALDILIVDDSSAIRKILLRVLGQIQLALGNVFEAADGIEALKILEEHPVGLILSDINMPNMDGLQMLTSIQQRPEWSNIPIIMITTEGAQSRVMEAVELGARGYVRKPFTAEQIRDKISTCLSSEMCHGH